MEYTEASLCGPSCICRTCDKEFHYLGIATHRAMHKRKNEDCVITYSTGGTCIHKYSKEEKSNE